MADDEFLGDELGQYLDGNPNLIRPRRNVSANGGGGSAVNPFSQLYYRYVFLRENRLARTIASLAGSPKVPSREVWEAEYEKGCWGRLNDLSEQAHNAVVLSYITHLRPESSVLEIGCGEGSLLRRLKQVGYRKYTGIDISEFIIGQCQRFNDDKTAFVACDAESYVPGDLYDIIALNECIYYFVQPVVTLQRYADHLTPDGLFVISIFDKDRTRPIRRCLKDTFFLVDETVISNSKGTWHCLVLSPRRPSNPSASPPESGTFQ